MRKSVIIIAISMLLTSPIMASDIEDDIGGVLNPDEMSLNWALKKAVEGDVGMVVCSQGYLMTKKGNHEDARKLFENCAKAGFTGTMTWLSYMNQNGLGAEESAKASAEWDRRAAELGDPVGEFNYGLNLLRGYGVEQNEDLGRQLIDSAADRGIQAARELQESGYDPKSVTPDADEWKFEKRVF